MLKRSRQITLVLIGTAALPACSPGGPAIVHDRYATLEDCTADWGRPESCDREDAAAVTSYGANGGGGGGWNGGSPIGRILYRGPDYPVGERMQSQFRALQDATRSGALGALPSGPTSHAIEHAVPSRGGFGSSSHFFGRLG